MKQDRVYKGLILVIVGVILLIYKMDILPPIFPHYVFTWPMIVIVIGLSIMLVKREIIGGLIVAAVGGIFLAREILPGFNPFEYWPIFIILFGIIIIFNKKNDQQQNRNLAKIEDKELEEITIFSGAEKLITSDEFNGGDVTTIFGGSEINLLHSSLAPGKNTINVFAMFGGSTFYVPSDWRVRVEVVAIFGGFNDKRMLTSSTFPDNDRELVIKGFVMFGGGEIKSL